MPQLIPHDVDIVPYPVMPFCRTVANDEAITSDYPRQFRERIHSLMKSEFFLTQRRFVELREQLAMLSRLRRNWDSYDADPPNEAARMTAHRILAILEHDAYPPCRIVASAEGGVGLCFVEGDRYADIECLNSGEILAAKFRGDREPTVWETENVDRSIKATIEQIRVHIAA
jgi:hypothetical protein